jgi:hypothetical protein
MPLTLQVAEEAETNRWEEAAEEAEVTVNTEERSNGGRTEKTSLLDAAEGTEATQSFVRSNDAVCAKARNEQGAPASPAPRPATKWPA